MKSELIGLGFALAAYRADRGSYPAKLAQLSPQYIAKLPKDIFNHDAELQYRLEGEGYRLYSVGLNGKDDGGNTQEDDASGKKGWDDIVVRVPASSETKK